MATIPEHHFTEDQIATFCKLLGTSPKNLSRKMVEEYLLGAGRGFTSSLVQQNYPSNSQIEKSLEKIESAAARLRASLLNPLTTPYMRLAAGDVAEDDRTLSTAVVEVENLGRWSKEAREEIGRSDEGERSADAERKPKGKPRGRAKRMAMRVLIHRLALLWLHTHKGTPPTVSVKKDGSSSGQFIRFAQSYIKAMRKQTTSEHRRYAGNIDKELDVSADAIVSHLKIFKAR